MPAYAEMESLFWPAGGPLPAEAHRAAAARLASCRGARENYRVWVLIEAERPLGARTVVVQLLKMVAIAIAAMIGRRMFRIVVCVVFL